MQKGGPSDHVNRLSTPIPSTLPSYFGLAFLLPTYYKKIFPDTEDFVYIFSVVLGVVLIAGACLKKKSRRDSEDRG